MAKVIPQETVGEFSKQGFVKLQELLSPYEVAMIKDEIQKLISSPPSELLVMHERRPIEEGDPQQSTLRKLRNIAAFSVPIKVLCTGGPLASAAKGLLGGPVAFFGDQVLFKSARNGSAKPLHQDIAYFRVQPPNSVITIWCAIDDADENNGCMHYVPGSHLLGAIPHEQWAGTPHLVAQVLYPHAIAVPAKSGDCLVHHALTLHMTPPNLSERGRLAFLAHYVRQDAFIPPRSSKTPAPIPI